MALRTQNYILPEREAGDFLIVTLRVEDTLTLEQIKDGFLKAIKNWMTYNEYARSVFVAHDNTSLSHLATMMDHSPQWIGWHGLNTQLERFGIDRFEIMRVYARYAEEFVGPHDKLYSQEGDESGD